MRRLLWILCVTLQVFLVACGGGGDGNGLASTGVDAGLSVERLGDFSADGPRIGDRLTATGSVSGLRFGSLAGATMRLVERPADSAATVGTPQLNSTQALADFVADKPGRYTVEYVAILSDGSTTPPVYATVLVRPHEVFFTVTASSPSRYDPAPPADSDRIEVELRSDLDPDTRPVSLFLDGSLVGTREFPNAIRLTAYEAGRQGGTRVYAFDIPNAQLGTGTHLARVVVLDLAGQPHEGSLAFVAGTQAQAGFGPFEDPAP